MRREIDWLVTGFCIVGFAVATAQARIDPADSRPFILDLRAGAGEKIVLQLKPSTDQKPNMMLSSLSAGSEQELFGITPEPTIAEVEPALVHSPVPVRAQARVKSRKPSRPAPAKAPAFAEVAPNVVTGTAKTTPMELGVPAATPGRGVALAGEEPASVLSRERLGFRLNERTSISLAPLSSVVPSYAAEAGHGDVGERWRLRDDENGVKTPGAAVGMTFKLN